MTKPNGATELAGDNILDFVQGCEKCDGTGIMTIAEMPEDYRQEYCTCPKGRFEEKKQELVVRFAPSEGEVNLKRV